MNRFVIAVALSITLTACGHVSEKHMDYTVTYSESKLVRNPHASHDPKLYAVSLFFAHANGEYTRDFEVHKRATYELGSDKFGVCEVTWFDGDSPGTDEEVKKNKIRPFSWGSSTFAYDESKSHPFVKIATLNIDHGEFSGLVDCERIDAPEAQKSYEDTISPVKCFSYWEDERFEFERIFDLMRLQEREYWKQAKGKQQN